VLQRIAGIPVPVLFGGSVAIAALLLWRQGALGEVAAAVGDLRWSTVAAALVGYAVGLAVLAGRWHALVRMAAGTARPPVSAEVFLTSVIVNYAAPIGLAVPARAALSKRDLGLTGSGSGAVVLWEALLDLTVLAGFGGLWLVLGGVEAARVLADRGGQWLLPVAVAGAIGAVGIAVAAAASRRLRERLRRFSGDALRLPAREPGWAALAGGLTLLFWAIQLAVFGVLLAGVGVRPSASLLFGLLGWPMFFGMVSPLPGGAGLREALMVAVAGLVGADGGAVLTAALLYRMALFAALPAVFLLARLWRARTPGPETKGDGSHG